MTKYVQIAFALPTIFVIGFFWYVLSTPTDQSKTPLRVGYQNSPAMALIMVAEDQGYFKAPNAAIRLEEFTAGKFALQAFLGGSLDVAVAGDVPTGLALLQDQKFRVVGEVLRNSTNEVRMIVRNDGGCAGLTPQSYFEKGKGKRRIATSFGGGPEYFTFTFLEANGIPIFDVELISQKPEEMPAAIESGSVDAISIFDPQASQAETSLGTQSCTFPDPKDYRQHYVIVTTPELGDNVDSRLRLFFDGLGKAERFIRSNPGVAKRIVNKKTTIGLGDVERMWGAYDFGVTLDPGLESLWKKQATWQHNKPGVPEQFVFARPEYDKVLVRTYLAP